MIKWIFSFKGLRAGRILFLSTGSGLCSGALLVSCICNPNVPILMSQFLGWVRPS